MPRLPGSQYWVEETDIGKFVVYIPSSVVLLQEDAEYARLYEALAEYAARKYSELILSKRSNITTKVFIIRPPLARFDFVDPNGNLIFNNDDFKITLTETSADNSDWKTIFTVAYNKEQVTIAKEATDFTYKGLFIKGFTLPQPDPPVRLVRFQKGDDRGPVIDLVGFRNERGDVVIPGPPVIVYSSIVSLLGLVNRTGDLILDMSKLSVVVEPIDMAPLYIKLVAQEVIP